MELRKVSEIPGKAESPVAQAMGMGGAFAGKDRIGAFLSAEHKTSKVIQLFVKSIMGQETRSMSAALNARYIITGDKALHDI